MEMMRIPVIQESSSRSETHGHLKYSDCRPLPASYMSGYSVLELVAVDKLDQANPYTEREWTLCYDLIELRCCRGMHNGNMDLAG